MMDYVSDARSRSICLDRDLDALHSGDSDCDIVPSLKLMSPVMCRHSLCPTCTFKAKIISGLNMMIVLLTYSNFLYSFMTVNHTQYCMHCKPISMPISWVSYMPACLDLIILIHKIYVN